VTTPTNTPTTTAKINQSSATALTIAGPVVGVRNDGQQQVRSNRLLIGPTQHDAGARAAAPAA
jgi:hypothetical protein